MKTRLLFAPLFLFLLWSATAQTPGPPDAWVVIVPWHGAGQPKRNCYISASKITPMNLRQPLVETTLDKPGDSCVQYFYPAATIDVKFAADQKQWKEQVDSLRADIKALSDSNDALTKRLNDMEKHLNDIEKKRIEK